MRYGIYASERKGDLCRVEATSPSVKGHAHQESNHQTHGEFPGLDGEHGQADQEGNDEAGGGAGDAEEEADETLPAREGKVAVCRIWSVWRAGVDSRERRRTLPPRCCAHSTAAEFRSTRRK